MDNRNRVMNILYKKSVDRMPALHFGYWKELLQEWADQGHISRALAKTCLDGTAVDRHLDKLLGWDCCYTPRTAAITCVYPRYNSKTLRRADGGRYYIDGNGVTLFEKDGAQGIPTEVDHLLKDRESYIKYYKDRMRYKKIRNLGSKLVLLRNKTDYYPRGYNVGSAIGTIRNICTVVGLSYLLYDDYELVKEIVDDFNNMQYQCLETMYKRGAKLDFLHYWEDICFKNGPLISPEMFKELCLPHYKRVSELAKSYGTDFISVDCDGDIVKLAPIWEEAGVNVMFPIEYGTWEGDIAKIRKVAPTLLGIGGMNKNVLSLNEDAVDREIERLRPLVKLGGYIPCPDHRLPQGTKFELVKYYTSKIKTIME
jgi:hypothetical protein